MFKFVLCDSDPQHNKCLQAIITRTLKRKGVEGEVVLSSSCPEHTIKMIKSNRFQADVYILGINFPNKTNGIELAKKIRKRNPMAYIIFITSSLEYCLLCYKVKTFDFLVKPVSAKVIEDCLENLLEDRSQILKYNQSLIAIKSGVEVYSLNPEEIMYIEKYGNLALIHTLEGTIKSYIALRTLEEQLEKHRFCRCHKSYLVNTYFIKRIIITNNTILLKNGDMVPISRSRKKELLDCMGL